MTGAPAPATVGPRLYRGLQRLLAPGAEDALPAQLAARLGGWRPVGPALDLGCGDASLLARLGIAPIVGLDTALDRLRVFRDADPGEPADERSVRTATRRPAVLADATRVPLRDASVGLAFCCGLLHHLPDAAAALTLAEMHRVTAPGGRIVVFDAVLPARPARRPLAAAIRGLDRGRFMRDDTALRALLGAVRLDWQIDRVTYAASGLEGLWCVAQRPVATDSASPGRACAAGIA